MPDKPPSPRPPCDPKVGRITRTREGSLFCIGIDRVPKLNGFTPAMCRQLAEAFTEFEHDSDSRVAIVFTHGDHFTAGLDLAKMRDDLVNGVPFTPPGLVDPFDLVDPRRTKPVVTAVEGITFTLGIELMLASDIVVASSDCRFAQLEVRRGIMANAGATLRFVERAGWGNAMWLLLTGQEFDAETAHRLGFVQEVTPPGEAYPRARTLAENIATGAAPLAVRAMRENASLALREGWQEAIKALGPEQARLIGTEDAEEGVRSFVERRQAEFTGQ